MSTPRQAFIDFEANGLDSWPIEVAWVLDDLSQAGSMVIAPASGWNPDETWSIGAEEVHGISLHQARKHGLPAVDVAERMNSKLNGLVLISDSSKDWQWWRYLYKEAGIQATAMVPRAKPLGSTPRYAWEAETGIHDLDIVLAARSKSFWIFPEAHWHEWSALKEAAGIVEHIALHDSVGHALGWLAFEVLKAPDDRQDRIRADIVEKAKTLLASHARPFRSWVPWEEGML